MRTQGIVLREIRYKDTSKILTIYTKEYGKISVMARGAYKPKSSIMANTQLFSYNEYEMYKGKTFYHLNQGDIIDSFYSIREKMERVYYGYYMLELIDKSLPDEQANEKLFLLLKKGLEVLRNLEENFLKFIIGYELKFISFLGYKPVIEKCVVCQGKVYNSIYKFLYTKLEDVENITINQRSLYKLHNILVKYILYNIDRRSLNSLNWIDCLED
jgi:DNA repair protein RecO (recombination protein O)